MAPPSGIAEMNPGEFEAIAGAIRIISPVVVDAVGAEGFNILNNCGRVAGQLIEHVHFHIIPRKTADGLGFRWNTFEYEEGLANKLAARITDKLEQG